MSRFSERREKFRSDCAHGVSCGTLEGGTLDGTGRNRMGRVRQPLFQGGATDEPVWLVCAVIRRFRRDFSACRAILHFDFGETVSFSRAKLYN